MSSLTHDFSSVTTEKLKRSTTRVPIRCITSFKQGALIPLGFYDVIPNSDIVCDVDAFVRLGLTPKRAFMGDMYFTYGAYFVPYRVLYQKYPEMFGNGKPTEWSNPTEFVMATGNLIVGGSAGTIATLGTGYDACINSSINTSGNIVAQTGNLADYLALPLVESGATVTEAVNIAPFLAYERIWSDYWRDENYQNIDPDLDKMFNASSGSTSLGTCRFALHYANKFHDYFTSMLPDTQKGSSVSIINPLNSDYEKMWLLSDGIMLGDSNLQPYSSGTVGIHTGKEIAALGTTSIGTPTTEIHSTNLFTATNVNELRQAVALQRAKERNARTGSRSMSEAMRGVFEANAPAVLNQAEFLGGNTVKLNLMSVPQTSDDGTNGAVGKLGAFSATGSNTHAFAKTVNEPGLVMFVGTVRIKHFYTQGIDKYWKKTRRYDFYDPALAHISEQPVYMRELYAHGTSGISGDTPIGFNEAWVEYDKPIDKITGYLRNPSTADIKAWTLQDTFTSSSNLLPAYFYQEKGNEVANVSVDYNSSYDSYQFVLDFKANCDVTAPKPIKCIPGFIDHIIA